MRGPADGDEDQAVMDSNPGVRLGGAEVQNPDELLAKAVELAKEADAVIAVVGLNADWETEGYDRTTLALPGRTDELIAKVAAVNPKTVVVVQSVSLVEQRVLYIFKPTLIINVGFRSYLALGELCAKYRSCMVPW